MLFLELPWKLREKIISTVLARDRIRRAGIYSRTWFARHCKKRMIRVWVFYETRCEYAGGSGEIRGEDRLVCPTCFHIETTKARGTVFPIGVNMD